MKYDLILQDENQTIVSSYAYEPKEDKPYQSEADLEKFLLKELEAQGYERLVLKDEAELESNLKAQLERLNNINFTQTQWQNFYKQNIANEKLKIEDKTKILQTDNESLTFTNEKGEHKNIILLDRKEPLKNHLQVTSQLRARGGESL